MFIFIYIYKIIGILWLLYVTYTLIIDFHIHIDTTETVIIPISYEHYTLQIHIHIMDTYQKETLLTQLLIKFYIPLITDSY